MTATPSTGRAAEWAVVAGVFAAVLLVVAVWLAVDRHPPEWDYANHLEHAVRCWREITAGDFEAVFGHSPFYPPLVPCAGGLVYAVFPSDVVFGQIVVLGFLALGMAATYVLGRRWAGGAGGVVAATLFGTAPFVVHLALHFQLDVPLASMVAVALVALANVDRFRRRRWAAAAGILLGLGMLTKPPFAVYVGPACLLILARTRGARAWLNATLAGVLATLIAWPWYGSRLLGLPVQIQNRSFRQAAEAGAPEPLSPASLAYYPTTFPVQFGLVAVLLFLIGLVVVIRRRQWLVLAGLAPFAVFLLLQNKQLRYTLPLLPVAAVVAGVGFSALPRAGRVAAGAVIALVAVLQLSSTAFGLPGVLRLAGIPLTVPTPPSGLAWPHRRILALIVSDAGGAPRAVSVTPNHPHFSPANFRYYAVRDELPLRIGRAWESDPVAVEYMILKTGDVGPWWTADKIRRVSERLEADTDLARVFPVIGEFTLPDGSRASVRARRIPPGVEATPDGVARAVERGLRARLGEVTRDVEGLEIRLDFDAGILQGRITRLEISAAAATVGELRRRHAALLRLRDLRLVVDDVLVNPWSAVRSGRFDPLDAGRLSLERATVTSGDLRAFMGQVRGLGHTSLTLGDGFADMSVRIPGPDLGVRVRPVAATGRPFALTAERMTVGGLPVPSPFVGWIMRSFDPSRGIAARVPFPLTFGPLTVTPGAIRVGG